MMGALVVDDSRAMRRIVRALAAGAHEYLTKPFQRQDLWQKLEFLGLSQLGLPRISTERLSDVLSTPPHLTISWAGEPVVLTIRSAFPEWSTP